MWEGRAKYATHNKAWLHLASGRRYYNEKLFEQLRSYLFNQYNINSGKIRGNSSLLYDLELYGDDVDDFFNRLIKDFKIEVKELDLSKYFIGDEPFDFFSPMLRYFKKEKIANKPTITIEDVIKFIETGILK